MQFVVVLVVVVVVVVVVVIVVAAVAAAVERYSTVYNSLKPNLKKKTYYWTSLVR